MAACALRKLPGADGSLAPDVRARISAEERQRQWHEIVLAAPRYQIRPQDLLNYLDHGLAWLQDRFPDFFQLLQNSYPAIMAVLIEYFARRTHKMSSCFEGPVTRSPIRRRDTDINSGCRRPWFGQGADRECLVADLSIDYCRDMTDMTPRVYTCSIQSAQEPCISVEAPRQQCGTCSGSPTLPVLRILMQPTDGRLPQLRSRTLSKTGSRRCGLTQPPELACFSCQSPLSLRSITHAS